MMVDFLIECELPFVVVLTKKDKLSKKQQEERLGALQQELPYADQDPHCPLLRSQGRRRGGAARDHRRDCRRK